jgi:predicted dehydrogenase
LCDVNVSLGRERCRELNLNCFTASFEELLANPVVDVVAIYTPDHLHAEHLIRCNWMPFSRSPIRMNLL